MSLRNLVNLKSVSKGYGSRSVLNDVTLGVFASQRVGLVGGNGHGKSTLLRLICGVEQPDSGQLTRTGDVRLGLLHQRETLEDRSTAGEVIFGSRAEHEWAADASRRAVLEGLLGGNDLARLPQGPDTVLGQLSGGERRRVALACLLLDDPELLLLDEPTNHLDVEAIDWLAGHLASRRGSLLVVTHDRWFLDAVCTSTWEVADRAVHQYDGGYAAYVLARAERERQDSLREDRRRQLLRKELAWLRRGPPARTAKPKFRVQAAQALIADEPQARDRTELLRFAAQRLGNKVIEALDLSFCFPTRTIISGLTWRLGPGERVALVGVNGSGKSTLMKLLAGELEPSSGTLQRGSTVRLAHLSQQAEEIPAEVNVIESLEQVRQRSRLSDGREITATKLCERFGFPGGRAYTQVSELSGGERRRLRLMRLLMTEPNVLLLDEPTNDLDIETLTALEDLLDEWPGTMAVVSHDRYFIERVCDEVYMLSANGSVRHLPGGIEQYIQLRDRARQLTPSPRQNGSRPTTRPGTMVRAVRKQLARIERELERADERKRAIHEQMLASSTDHLRLAELQGDLQAVADEQERLESAWLESSEQLE